MFGVQDPGDTALAVVDRVRARFPEADIHVVIDPAEHGPNREIGNLINTLPAARHDLLVIADSDLHVRPDFLERIVAALEQPGCGLVTTLYAGWPGRRSLVGALGRSRSRNIFCRARCWRAAWAGKIAWGPRWRCGAARWSGSAGCRRW